jgi:hypothetical protein
MQIFTLIYDIMVDFDLTDASLTIGVAGIAAGIGYMIGNFVSAFVTAVSGSGSALAAVPYNEVIAAGIFAGFGLVEIRSMYRSWRKAQNTS